MKHDLEAIKNIPISDVLEYVGYQIRKSGSWVSVKGDPSLKANTKKNNYTDFSGRLGRGTTIDLIMNTQGVDFQRACEILFNHFLGGTPMDITPVTCYTKTQPTPMSKKFIPNELAKKLLSTKNYVNNNFAKFLHENFKFSNETLQKLNVGTNKTGDTVFLYQNHLLQYEAVKVVPYDTNGKRTGNILTPEGYRMQDGYTFDCFFNANTAVEKDIVFVVESEKTAVIATLYFNNPKFAFVASGGAEKLPKLLRSSQWLQDKKVVLLPDNDDAGKKWHTIKYDFRNFEDLHCWVLDIDAPEKYDLADFILEQPDGYWLTVFNRKLAGLLPVEELPKKEEPPKATNSLQSLLDELDFEDSPTITLPTDTEPEPTYTTAAVYEKLGLNHTAKSESQLYWERRDAEKEPMPDSAEITAIKQFFDNKVLPERMYFQNNEGKTYMTIYDTTNYVMIELANLKEAQQERNSRMVGLIVHRLKQVKTALEQGGYMLPQRLEEAPF